MPFIFGKPVKPTKPIKPIKHNNDDDADDLLLILLILLLFVFFFYTTYNFFFFLLAVPPTLYSSIPLFLYFSGSTHIARDSPDTPWHGCGPQARRVGG